MDYFTSKSMFMKLMFGAILFFSSSCFAQKDSIAPAYKRYPTVPAFQLFLTDSTVKYTKESLPKKRPTLIMLFSPDCEHCKHHAEQMFANKEALKGINIVMATSSPIYRMKEFAETYRLYEMENVVVAKDPYYLLVGFYEIKSLPYLAMYDKKGKLIQTFEGSLGIDKVLQIFQNN